MVLSIRWPKECWTTALNNSAPQISPSVHRPIRPHDIIFWWWIRPFCVLIEIFFFNSRKPNLSNYGLRSGVQPERSPSAVIGDNGSLCVVVVVRINLLNPHIEKLDMIRIRWSTLKMYKIITIIVVHLAICAKFDDVHVGDAFEKLAAFWRMDCGGTERTTYLDNEWW